MKCRFCGCERFYAHQEVRMDIMVDGNNAFSSNCPEGAEAAIYDSGTPYGPYICARCGAEYEELEEGAEPTEQPCEGWQKKSAAFTKELDKFNQEEGRRVQKWVGDSYSVLIVFCEGGYSYLSVSIRPGAGKYMPEIFVVDYIPTIFEAEDSSTMVPAGVTVETTSYGALDATELKAYMEQMQKAQKMAELIDVLFVRPIREGTFNAEETFLFYD